MSFFYVILNAQEVKHQSISDSVFIQFNENLLSKNVLINEIDYLGDRVSISYSKNNTLFLFLTDKLLLLHKIQNKEKDSLTQIKDSRIEKFEYGFELENYSLSFNEAEINYRNYFKYIDNIDFDSLKISHPKQVEEVKRIIQHTFKLPLSSFFANKKDIENFNVFNYKGTKSSYESLKEIIAKPIKLFIILPTQKEIFGYDFRVLEVKKVNRNRGPS